ncbi:MAG TPA: CBS domain-containing protein [Polyangiaceae bacterium]|jgi:signal-transduction protein with cAMP-binding, CBS, and nucleotidyltransferase domain|nr:CBS domain-containing protein [Polyangiaceae bacterium]
MATKVSELMNKQPIKLPSSSPIIDAARKMAEAGIGAVLVEDGDKLCGVVTDRDITIRAVAKGRDPAKTKLAEICSSDLATVSAEDELDHAIEVMRDKAVRRVVVTDGQRKALGVLSLGDLALERDPRSVLGQISAAPANH